MTGLLLLERINNRHAHFGETIHRNQGCRRILQANRLPDQLLRLQ